jgi:hypothetical protein
MRHIVHRHVNRLDYQIGIHRHANLHVMYWFIRLPGMFSRDIEHGGLGITQMAFNVPQTIFALKALVVNTSGVRKRARLCRR